MHIKLVCIIGILIRSLINISIKFLWLLIGVFIVLCLGLYVFLPWYFFFVIFVNVSQFSYLFFTNFNDYNASWDSIFVLADFNIDNDVDGLEKNNNVSSNDLWLYFSALVLFLKVWSIKTSKIKVRLFVLKLFISCFFCTSKLKLLIMMKL